MVQRCCVPLCDTKVGDLDINRVKVRFHRIPLTPEKFLKWREKITNGSEFKPEPELTVNSRICSKHFLREDYISLDSEKPGTSGNHVLAKDAIPSVFKWNDSSGNECEISRAIPYIKKSKEMEVDEGPLRNQEVQCSLQEEKLQEDIFRKNLIIRQLLQKLADLEENEKLISKKKDKPPPSPISTPVNLNSSPEPEISLTDNDLEMPKSPTEDLAKIPSLSGQTRSDQDIPVITGIGVPVITRVIKIKTPPVKVKTTSSSENICKPPKKRKFEGFFD